MIDSEEEEIYLLFENSLADLILKVEDKFLYIALCRLLLFPNHARPDDGDEEEDELLSVYVCIIQT